MNNDLQKYVNSLNTEYHAISYSQSSDLLLAAILIKEMGYNNFTEVGTWLGGTPIMLKKLENYFGGDRLTDLVLVENLQDHLKEDSIAFEFGITSNDKLKEYIKYHISSVNITIHNDVSQINNEIDIVHFDSVKDHINLIYQFDLLKKYYKPTTMFIFDDYSAEWPDVMYGADLIASYNNLEQVAALGHKAYLCSPSLKEHILNLVKSSIVFSQFLEVRKTFKHGELIGSR